MLNVEIVYADSRGVPYVRDRFSSNGHAEAEVRARHELDVGQYLASAQQALQRGPVLARIQSHGSVVWILTIKEREAERQSAAFASTPSKSHQTDG
ncbi:hypothetical protein [Methylobacterium sp. WL9]|uniref:hypothetical protein n=1 Tax=Methylobacterium sp. WL9 TaxID=2603898 RepID=UPI0016500465|nr:hypothetical protein [Methylobacterium sp. WL9]